MRGRIGFAWALAANVILAFLLVSACQSGYQTGTSAGMSSPLTPAAFIESSLAAQLPQLQFDGHGPCSARSPFSARAGGRWRERPCAAVCGHRSAKLRPAPSTASAQFLLNNPTILSIGSANAVACAGYLEHFCLLEKLIWTSAIRPASGTCCKAGRCSNGALSKKVLTPLRPTPCAARRHPAL